MPAVRRILPTSVRSFSKNGPYQKMCDGQSEARRRERVFVATRRFAWDKLDDRLVSHLLGAQEVDAFLRHDWKWPSRSAACAYALFSAQRDHWVNARRPRRRQGAGENRNSEQRGPSPYERERVLRCHAEE
jgi:hypothetical protein